MPSQAWNSQGLARMSLLGRLPHSPFTSLLWMGRWALFQTMMNIYVVDGLLFRNDKPVFKPALGGASSSSKGLFAGCTLGRSGGGADGEPRWARQAAPPSTCRYCSVKPGLSRDNYRPACQVKHAYCSCV